MLNLSNTISKFDGQGYLNQRTEVKACNKEFYFFFLITKGKKRIAAFTKSKKFSMRRVVFKHGGSVHK